MKIFFVRPWLLTTSFDTHGYFWGGGGIDDTILHSLCRLESVISSLLQLDKFFLNLGICGLQNGQSHMLTLSDCHPVKYTCNNGQCIDLSNKCDGLIDCADGTDELECEFLVLDKNYSKNKLPLIQKDEPVKVYFRRVMLVCH